MAAVSANLDDRPSGLPVGPVAWGSHVCHFYDTAEDLLEVLVPYFAAGLRANERCVWITSAPLSSGEARAALERELSDLGERLRCGQLEIFAHDEWYLVNGGELERVIDGWLQREARALADGYEGLRVAGNTSWLEPEDWRRFVAYEAAAGRAFRSRRILALCNYSLPRLGSDELLDVIDQHGFALARHGGCWEAIESATTLIASREGARHADDDASAADDPHRVRFFHGDDYPAERIAGHLAAGLRAGGGAIAFARGAQRLDAISAALRGQSIDVAAALASEQLILRDADALARAGAECGMDGVLAPLLQRVGGRAGVLHCYGEIVDCYVRAGNTDGALELEGWWDDLRDRKALSVLCGYELGSFPDASSVEDFRRVCAAHGEVEPVDAGARPGNGRVVAELQQSRSALATEVRHRRHSDGQRERLRQAERSARARAEAVTEQLVRLQRVMSALSEVTRPAEVARVVAVELAAAVGAQRARLVVDGRDEPGADAAAGSEPPPAGPAHSVCVPLLLRGERLGAIELSFAAEPPRSASRRALVTDCARQVAFALDRALAYEVAERERERAEQSSRAKDEFLAMLGHELRNPLAPIVTALDLMKLGSDAPPPRELQVIERHVQHMTGLVDDLMDIARVTRGVLSLRKEPVEIAAVLGRAVEMVTPLLEVQQHRLSVSAPERGLQVEGDPGRLTQVVSNLLTNAARYSPSGCELSLSAAREAGAVVIRMRDRGMGIEPELLPHIFEPFRQGRRELERGRGGLGLGLALVRSLVHLHGGRVDAHSDGPGRGSEFVVHLPALDLPAQPLAPALEAAAASASGSRRVLLVDDNEDAVDMLALVLGRSGYEVRVANDGPQALRCIAEFRPHAAVLDIGLPVMDGYELAGRLRAELGDGLHMVALTGYGQKTDVARSQKAGFALHLVKPAQAKQLLSALEQLVLAPARPAEA